MIHSSFASKLEDYAHLRERNSKHSRDISRLQRELDDLKLQQGMLKQEMTPRDGPSTHRVLGTERRPEMYFPKPGGEESLKPPKDRDTTENESGDKKPYFLDLGKDNSPRDQPDSTRDKHDDRRPEMYGGDEDKPKDPIRRNDRPVYIERRPEYYWSGEYSPRKDDNFDVEELRKRDRENKYSFYDTTAINPQDWKKNESGRKYPYYDHSVRLISVIKIIKVQAILSYQTYNGLRDKFANAISGFPNFTALNRNENMQFLFSNPDMIRIVPKPVLRFSSSVIPSFINRFFY